MISACSAGTILGYPESRWWEALESGQSLPLPTGARLSELTRLGPGTLLFMAMQAEGRQDQDSASLLFLEAATYETGLYGRLAAERYLRLLRKLADGPGLLAFSSSDGSRNLSPWERARSEAEALLLTGAYERALGTWTKLFLDFPEEALNHESSLRSGIVQAALGVGTPEAAAAAAAELEALLWMAGDVNWYRDMGEVLMRIQAVPAWSTLLDEGALLLAKARVLSGTRDYGASVLAFRQYLALAQALINPGSENSGVGPASGENQPISSPSPAPISRNEAAPGRLSAESGASLAAGLNRPALADMARAFLFGSRSEGEEIFKLLASQAQAGFYAPREAYLYLFWAGRFARAAESWRQAASLFASAAENAEDGSDLDAALWYEAETRSKYSSSEAAAVLARAYSSTANPAYYSDLLEPLSRKALADRSGTVLAVILSAAAPMSGTSTGAGSKDRARLDYLGARAAATGLLTPGQIRSLYPAVREESVQGYIDAALNRVYRQDTDPWYRLLAAFRLGLPLVEPADGPGAPEPPQGPIPIPESQSLSPGQGQENREQPELTETPGEADALARGMIRFGLAARVRTELGQDYRTLAPSTIREVAETLTQGGDYSTAIRAMVPLFSRPGYIPTSRDRQLYWPQAFLPETRAAADRFRLPEALLFGLVRSESLFQPEVISRAGAVGLAQLMPVTAAETAGRLRMASYELTDPGDNLSLGASYFRRILDNQNGRYMPAIFSYNAGPTRFRRWENQYGPLPQDLLLEVLDYGETRQYGRNVVAAAMAYAALYYTEDLHGFMAELLGEAKP